MGRDNAVELAFNRAGIINTAQSMKKMQVFNQAGKRATAFGVRLSQRGNLVRNKVQGMEREFERVTDRVLALRASIRSLEMQVRSEMLQLAKNRAELVKLQARLMMLRGSIGVTKRARLVGERVAQEAIGLGGLLSNYSTQARSNALRARTSLSYNAERALAARG